MRPSQRAFAVGVALSLGVCGASAQRTALTPVQLTKIEYPVGGTREKLNQKANRLDKYDLDQRIVYDENSGDFLLQWNGSDGKRKTVVYHPANRLHAAVVAQTSPLPSGNGLRYVYAVRNLPNSQRDLQVLYLSIGADVNDAASPDATWGPSVPFTEYLTRSLKVPRGWRWAQTRSGRAGLRPGEGAYGFAFSSRGLPAPVQVFVDIQKGMKGVDEEAPEELLAALDPITWVIPKGWTVGPVAPPSTLEPSKFLTDMRGMVDTALQQGWILSPAVAKEMSDALSGASAVMSSADNVVKRRNLQAILKTVEEEKDKALLSEAYAILKYNLEFLLTRMPQ